MPKTILALFLCLFCGLSISAQSFYQQLLYGEGSYYYPYNRSSSCSWGDVDSDGDLDLFVTNGESFESNEFYLNNGDGSFNNISNAITYKTVASFGSAFGDYDNDGDLDLYVANCDYINEEGVANFLFRNNGKGIFTKITEGPPVEDEDTSYGCSWVDYDNDGWLDLFVANAYSKANRLYRNNGNGGFERITEGALVSDTRHNIGGSWADIDNDGDADLLTINPNNENEFYLNQGDGTFQKIENFDLGFEYASYCRSASWADYDNDGWLDVVLVDGQGRDHLYNNDGDGTFTRVEEPSFMAMGGLSGNGSTWGDFDNDGDLDLILMHHFSTPKEYHQNNGDGTFTRLVETALNYNNNHITYALATADYDNDGRLDFFQTNRYLEESEGYGWPGSLFRNTDESCRNHVGISLRGTNSNSFGVGSRVSVYYKSEEGEEKVQHQELQSLTGGGYTAQSGLRLHFGLGFASAVDSIIVSWPSGEKKLYSDLPTNTHLILSEDGDFLNNEQLYQMKLEAVRNQSCPGRIDNLEVFNARTGVTWYSDKSEYPIATGRIFYVPVTNGTTLYRAVDACGRSVEYMVTEQFFESKLFPNPVSNTLFLNLATYQFAPNAKITIHNAAGQWIWSEEFELEPGYNKMEIDVSGFSSGTYFLEIESACYNSVEKILVVR